ncbi:uncharacterized protein LOC105694255 [Orussus abietinus]|uniref:uncharacterized protein LOC105694255 n=1 Tax=Orussus abietinus TaxID=222816 RepID=UPI000625B268|nr:uncharacterized protein LOC105694255 [Orussus abietinus]
MSKGTVKLVPALLVLLFLNFKLNQAREVLIPPQPKNFTAKNVTPSKSMEKTCEDEFKSILWGEKFKEPPFLPGDCEEAIPLRDPCYEEVRRELAEEIDRLSTCMKNIASELANDGVIGICVVETSIGKMTGKGNKDRRLTVAHSKEINSETSKDKSPVEISPWRGKESSSKCKA